MTRIFISYDRDDRTITRQLAAQLRRVYGYDEVWFDENIRGGADWWAEIRRQIARCDIFMFLLSDESLKSEYCQRERDEADRLNKKILPVRIAPVTEIPENLRNIQYVDMSEGEITVENFTELTAAIQEISDRLSGVRRTRILSTQEAAKAQARNRARRQTLLLALGLLLVVLGAGAFIVQGNLPLKSGAIAFTSSRDGNPEIYLANGGLGGWFSGLLGRNPRNITQDRSRDEGATWSPDGTRIAFVSYADGKAGIYTMRADGGDNPTRLADGFAPAWSPDGLKIAFARIPGGQSGRDIFLMNPDGSSVSNITNSPTDDSYPTWSPDSLKIAYQSRTPRAAEIGLPNQWERWDIFIMDVDGANVRNLTNEADADDAQPAWSPNGRFVAYQSNRARIISDVGSTDPTIDNNPEVYVLNTAGGQPIDITNHTANDSFPAWSPDGTQMAFVSDRDGNLEVYVMDVACIAEAKGCVNVPARRLTNAGEADVLPVWRPS